MLKPTSPHKVPGATSFGSLLPIRRQPLITEIHDSNHMLEIISIKPKQAASTQPLDIDAVEAVQAIIEHNDSCSNSADKWAISYPVMKDLLSTLGKDTQSTIKAVFDVNSTLIDQHHRKHGLNQLHNQCHKNQSITDVVDF